MRKFTLAFFFIASFYFLNAQSSKTITVKYTNTPITLDGILDESDWNTSKGGDNFWQYFPTDTIKANQQSEIKMLFDDRNLYIGIKVFAAGNNYVTQSLKRDFRAGNSDNITLLFDTFNDGNNAYLFGTNPYGVRREGLVSGGGTDFSSFSLSWDTKWNGVSKIYDNYYISEMTIPLTALKFKEGQTKWRFNSYRFDTQSNERSTWTNTPSNQNIAALAFMGEMIFEKPLGKPRTPIAIIPYINAQGVKDYSNDETDSKVKFGGDAKIAIGSSMNLDITINPDFSQVEADDQVTNLTRFEVSLSEKRQFFIDNSDLFAGFGGSRDANPFFSRRIGIAQNKDGDAVENPIIAGVRLSGKLTNNLRLGFLTIQTDEDKTAEIASNNNTVFALEQRVFSRSNISAFVISKQSFKDYDFLEEEEKYNRVIGIDYNLATLNNRWSGKAYLHKSFTPKTEDKDLSGGLFLAYNNRNFEFFIDGIYIGEDFKSDLGFIRRTDILKGVYKLGYTFWPKNSSITSHSFELFNANTWRPGLDHKLTDYTFNTSWSANFRNQSRLSIRVNNKYTYLTGGFDPTSSSDEVIANIIELPSNVGYYYNNYSFNYRSDQRKVFSYNISPSFGGFFNGYKSSISAQLNTRIQPKFSTSIKMEYHRIELPEPYHSTSIWLIAPKVNFTFSKSIFWSTFVQYTYNKNKDSDNNFGINSRLQWRFAPLSDLYLVYNDNYFVNNYSPRVRSINLKLTYWINI